jgi:hypothetical protein
MKSFTKVLEIPYAFLVLNGAAVAGLYYFLRGHEAFWDLARPAINGNVPLGEAPKRWSR